MIRKKLAFAICCLLLVVVIKNSTAQIASRNLFPTPNASAIQQYGQVPVNHFNGLPSVDVPITEFKSGELTVPISISYHAGSIKPADKPSWVGQGWSLNAGGVISRVINDMPDEFINLTKAYSEYNNGNSGITLPQSIENNKYGYFYHYGFLNSTDWATTKLQTEYQTLFPNQTVLSPQQYEALVNRKDKTADEFSFNFLGMSGSMYLGQDGIWKFKTKDETNFKVDVVMGPYIVQDPNSNQHGSTIYNCLTKFVLTGSDGTKYFFGADTMTNFSVTKRRYGLSHGTFNLDWGLYKKNFVNEDSTAVEFSRVGVGGGQFINGRDGGTVPMSWYLTKIKSVGGDSIVFDYSRDGYQIANRAQGQAYQYNCPTCTPTSGGTITNFGSANNLVIQDGVSLSSIKGINGKVEFKKSKANILDYRLMDDGQISQSNADLFCAYSVELFNYWPCGGIITALKSNFVKLDSIHITTGNEKLKSFAFRYTENLNNRLFLDTVKAIGSKSTTINSTIFKYQSPEKLTNVQYETRKIDHWGYYNGVDPTCSYWTNPGACNGTFNWTNLYNPNITAYKTNRTPNSDSMKLGVLTEIKYPTGGKTEFIWEANTYSKTINHGLSNNTLAIDVVDKGVSTIGAGLRIKQLKSYPYLNASPLIKSYFYNRDYVGQSNMLSSGVLNGSEPNYIEIFTNPGQFTYSKWTDANQSPMSLTNGNYITYSNVVEQNTDNSMKEYVFSNHDNGYKDNPPTAWMHYVYQNFSYQNFVTNSMELERGLLLKEKTYKQGNILLQQRLLGYNNASTRFANSVRKYVVDNKFSLMGTIFNFAETPFMGAGFFPGNPIFQGSNLFGLETYTYQPFLQTDTTDIFDENGLNPIRAINTYTYDSYRNKKTANTLNSKLENVEIQYNYSYDNIAGLSTEGQLGKTAMQSANMTGLPIETKTKKNSNDIQLIRNEFYTSPNLVNPNLYNWIKPKRVLEALGLNPPSMKSENVKISRQGRLETYKDNDGVPVSIEWGYKKEYPIAKIVNAQNFEYDTLVTTEQSYTSPFTINWNTGNGGNTLNFTTNQLGNITVGFSNLLPPPNIQLTCTYTLQGPGGVSLTGVLCQSGVGAPVCASQPTSITYSNLLAGNYSLSYSILCSPNSSYTFIRDIVCRTFRNDIYTIGNKEFFIENFEEHPNAITGNSHTGKKFLNTNYTTTFVKPNNRNYKIQWWNFDGAKWQMNETVYNNGMTLQAPVDNVRIFPENAFISSYTYNPLVGISSELDTRGRVIYYTYDEFSRLAYIRDNEKNVIKKFCYNYAGQPEDCYACIDNTANWQNTLAPIRCQKNAQNQNTGYQEQEQMDMNSCSPTYSQTQWVRVGNYIPANWQNTANIRCQTNSYGVNTGIEEQEQQDMNSCSETGGQTRWVTIGSNPTNCPIPPYVNLTSTNTYGTTGYIAKYTPITFLGTPGNGTPYYFNVPATTGLQPLGSVPAGNYTVEIYRTTTPIPAIFRGGCPKPVVTGTSATFSNINVSTCNSIVVTLEQ